MIADDDEELADLPDEKLLDSSGESDRIYYDTTKPLLTEGMTIRETGRP
ncbi:MAG: hypothetical protein JJE17_13250 [Peptostreptococcaceae bacterium]|nr:hypothetical protein [Peptostreptococcaceae bacterium]